MKDLLFQKLILNPGDEELCRAESGSHQLPWIWMAADRCKVFRYHLISNQGEGNANELWDISVWSSLRFVHTSHFRDTPEDWHRV